MLRNVKAGTNKFISAIKDDNNASGETESNITDGKMFRQNFD